MALIIRALSFAACCVAVAGFRVPAAVAPAAPSRTASTRAVVLSEAECAMIDLSTDDPVRVAQIIKGAWMEGGVKRGLTGSVLVPAENTVTIVAKGPRKRLDSFADWLETTSQLVSKVSIGEACAPEDVELTSKFEIAAVDPALSTPWREYLTQATIDVKSAAGKTHSSDEGLA